MHMKIGNTLFLKDLLDSSIIEEIFNHEYSNDNDDNNTLSYTPKATRGVGSNREGYCGMCQRWFKMKTSSYWYHMNYKHGINSKGEKYPEPRTRLEGDVIEGYCEKCGEWIVLCGKNSSWRFNWLRHMQKGHQKEYQKGHQKEYQKGREKVKK